VGLVKLSARVKSITVVGAVLAAMYLAYAWDGQQTIAVLAASITFATPLVLAACCGLLGERTGVINIGIEGQLLGGAFVAFVVASATDVFLGTLAGVATGLVMGLFLAVFAVRWHIDQIIAGTVITILATGLTSFLYKQGHVIKGHMPTIKIPLLWKIPLLGRILFENQPIRYLAIIVVIVLHVALFRTKWGLRSRAVGEHPSAADTVGVNVLQKRYVNVTIAGGLAGLGGAFLSLENAGTFERGMSANKGFLALALMITGRWRPYLAWGAALMFGLSSGLANQLQFKKVVDIPPQFINMLPYALTIVVLVIFAGKVRPPAAEGQPYVKE
jgi:simple sugar transport system permease protein